MAREFEDHCWRDFIDDETQEIYSHYKRDLFVGKNPAVLMVDVYKASYEGGQQKVVDVIKEHPSSCGERAWAMVEPAKQLLNAARTAGIPITYCTGDMRSQSSNGRATNRQVLDEHEGSYEILEELAPQSDELVVYKQRGECVLWHAIDVAPDPNGYPKFNNGWWYDEWLFACCSSRCKSQRFSCNAGRGVLL